MPLLVFHGEPMSRKQFTGVSVCGCLSWEMAQNSGCPTEFGANILHSMLSILFAGELETWSAEMEKSILQKTEDAEHPTKYPQEQGWEEGPI